MTLGFVAVLQMRGLDLAKHCRNFGTRADQITSQGETQEINVGAGREDAFSEVDSKVLGIQNFHDCLHVGFALFKGFADDDDVVEVDGANSPDNVRAE